MEPLTPYLRNTFPKWKYVQDIKESSAEYAISIAEIWANAFADNTYHPVSVSAQGKSPEAALRFQEHKVQIRISFSATGQHCTSKYALQFRKRVSVVDSQQVELGNGKMEDHNKA